MKISTILDHIDSGYMALPEFQRGYVWNRDQVRGLMDSLYRRHPVGSLLVWVTESEGAQHRGESTLAPGMVKLLLDGQQRITSLYGIIRGNPPKFFDGNADTFTGLRFNLESEEFSFFSPIKMKDDPLWVDITKLIKGGFGEYYAQLSSKPDLQESIDKYVERLNAIRNIKDIELHIEEVTGKEKTIDVVVDIFNMVNSGGTKLSKGDLALAKICAEWPDARETMREVLARWKEVEFHFDLDWLLRNINTVLTGEARFIALHKVSAEKFQDGLKRAEKACNNLLNVIANRLGLDHDRVLFGRYAFPVMSHYVDRRGGKLGGAKEQDLLLFWYLQNALWGRFSASTESVINKDLEVLENIDGALERLINELKLWRGDLTVKPEHFGGWSLGARFYPMLYLLTRIGEARDWGTGLVLKSELLGKQSCLQVHHIFPKAFLYKNNFNKAQVNAVANYCFLTQDTNLEISDKSPEVYFEKIERNFPGALASQWIPMERELWKVDNYLDFLEARKKLLADAANGFLKELLHGRHELIEMPLAPAEIEEITVAAEAVSEEYEAMVVPGGVESENEDQLIRDCSDWLVSHNLPEGEYLYELVNPETRQPVAIFDLAWPKGLQEGLSSPVALLIDEGPDTIAAASAAGFRYFTSIHDFKRYVEREILTLGRVSVG